MQTRRTGGHGLINADRALGPGAVSKLRISVGTVDIASRNFIDQQFSDVDLDRDRDGRADHLVQFRHPAG